METKPLLESLHDYFPFGFPVTGSQWDCLQMQDVLARIQSAAGGASGLYALRMLADRINARREHCTYAIPAVHAGELLGFELISDVMRYMTDAYCVIGHPGTMEQGAEEARRQRGHAVTDRSQPAFVSIYPPQAVLTGQTAQERFLDEASHGQPHRYTVTREMVLLSILGENTALRPIEDLYDDAELARQSPYVALVETLDGYFARQPVFPGFDLTLFELLRAPVKAHPDSLQGQLEYILKHWGDFLPDELRQRLLMSIGVIKEETLLRGWGPGPSQVLDFDYLYPEPAAFTHDKDWMSNVVLIAKSTYVWLDQLSKKHQRDIHRLDQVPDEELARLARWGFTGLWLIGLWERSPASQRIKQIMGNPEALSSAYSLYDYQIAGDLGGEDAYTNLRDRAWRYGIRLASDMVPNHVGLYSRWIVQHPDWFLQLDYPPFPSYRFTGPNLSFEDRVGLYIEDGYWNHSDAAVIFKRVDNWTGDTRYIYHGNDGTSTPWNDTAQLNFLIPEVREAVINTILDVARMFPILRFDAAMTLAKRHFQRLWFPKPGEAGAIPSRAEHGMTQAEFDKLFPREFWREVVDRIQREAPETLLLAEAFWLMEGYFVRTLGMHRVYNSAFMNMLKMEENLKYRLTVKNVLEFSPEVIKRFVNFMNNPDERTAVDQFGRDDKYFGVAIMMVTMPGLPMFGHGQIEGLTEKYGMEYRRAYWDEQVDEHMVWRHEMEVFPLMRKRHLFSGVANFAFYDCVTPDGWVDENVFAYSNRSGDDRALIVYNNAYTTTRGAIHTSTAINFGDAENKDLRRKTLAESLGLDTRNDCFYIFRDHRTRLEYLRSAAALAGGGLFVELNAYQYYAFLDFRAVYDTDGSWARLSSGLKGQGVPSVDDAYREMFLEPVHRSFRQFMNGDGLRKTTAAGDAEARELLEAGYREFLAALAEHTDLEVNAEEVVAGLFDELRAVRRFEENLKGINDAAKAKKYLIARLPKATPLKKAKARTKTEPAAPGVPAESPAPDDPILFWRIPTALVLAHQTGKARAALDFTPHASTDIDQWLLTRVVAQAFREHGSEDWKAETDAQLVKILAAHATLLDFFPGGGGAVGVRQVLRDPAVQRCLLMNRHQDVVWLNKERLEEMVYWLLFASVAGLMATEALTTELLNARLENAMQIVEAAAEAGYDVEKMLRILGKSAG
ncbi:MAG: alpha-amylase family glycosyl hydrolase [Candidatus Hydrogenedentes bacterium]|nr:alpha-amylase family glycosyl hydrolase [Candidatus Hydrogenedentota bacterium]